MNMPGVIGDYQFIILFSVLIFSFFDFISYFILSKYTYFLGIPIVNLKYNNNILINDIDMIKEAGDIKYKFVDEKLCLFRHKYNWIYSRSIKYLLKGSIKIDYDGITVTGKLPVGMFLYIFVFFFIIGINFNTELIFFLPLIVFLLIFLIMILFAIKKFKKTANKMIEILSVQEK
jgi:hypothetical protein